MADSRLAPPPPYRSLTTRAACATFFLSAVGVLHLFSFVDGGVTFWAAHELRAGHELTLEFAQAYDAVYVAVMFATALAFLGAFISFWTWFYRAHKNLRSLGNTDLEYRSFWAVVGFVIPFLNLVRPAQLMRETWYGSDPQLLGESAILGSDKTKRGTPRLVGWWWGSFLIMNILGRIEMKVAELLEKPNPSPGMYELYAWTTIVAALPALLAAILVVRLIWTITRRQSHRHDLLEGRAVLPEYFGPAAPAATG